MRWIFFCAVLGLCSSSHANGKQCTQWDIHDAEGISDFLDSWQKIHIAYLRFRQCDEGTVRARFSKAVTDLLAYHWSRLNELQPLIAADSAFGGFVVSHADEAGPHALKDIRRFAAEKCPQSAGALCAQISAGTMISNPMDSVQRFDGSVAEEAMDFLDNWSNVYLAYVRFRQEDDGAIAEGFSDAVARLLSQQWPRLKDAQAYMAMDSAFGGFILSHIDESADTGDLNRIRILAAKGCPQSALPFCKEILRQFAAMDSLDALAR